MMVTTTEEIPGKKVEKILGIVIGNTIRSRGLGGHISAAFEQLAGGEVSSYQKTLIEARSIAIKRMIKEAEKLKADAIIGVRLATSDIAAGASEVLAYGTAIKLNKK